MAVVDGEGVRVDVTDEWFALEHGVAEGVEGAVGDARE